MSGCRYLWHWVGSLIATVIVVGAVNYLIDPYGIYDGLSIGRLNSNKPIVKNHVRLHKAHALVRSPHRGLILGTSRAECGLDPEHEGWRDKAASRYNAGLTDANMYEALRYFQHAHQNAPLKQVVLGLDFLMFNINHRVRPGFEEGRLSVLPNGDPHLLAAVHDLPRTLISLDAIRASAYTLFHQANTSIYTDRGVQRLGWALKTHTGTLHSRVMTTERKFLKKFENYRLFDLDERSYLLDAFQQLVETCRRDDIELHLFISPSHARLWELVHAMGLWPTFEQWKRELVQVLEKDIQAHPDRTRIVLWDFSGYNTISTEDVPRPGDFASEMQWFWESCHYKPDLGRLILDKIFGYERPGQQLPNDIGIQLTANNIESHLATARARQKVYRGTHPEDVAEVLSLIGSQLSIDLAFFTGP